MTVPDPAPGGIAAVFVAMADPSRRQVIGVLASRGPSSATAVAQELAISRQAIAKHLATLTEAGLVESARHGREVRFALRSSPLRLAARWLEDAAGAWDDRLATLKDALERDQPSSRATG
jgi:DNA-binding transcriptional ArsR family regulator